MNISKTKIGKMSYSKPAHCCPEGTIPGIKALLTSGSSCRIFSDVAGDITIAVDGESFLLHKFPLVSRSGKIWKMVADSKNCSISRLELLNFPGGPQKFGLAMKFCYGMNFEISTANVPFLRCAADIGND